MINLDRFRDVDLVIDKANDNFIEKKWVSTGDKEGRTLTVMVTDGGVVGELPGASVSLLWTNKANGLTDETAFVLKDKATSKFVIEYPTHMLTAGTVIAQIRVWYDGKTITTKPFEITVSGIAGQMAGVVKQQEFGLLTAVLADANKLRTDIDRKADKTYVDTVIASIAAGGPKELFYSLAALRNKYPGGAEGTYLVFDASHEDGAHSYMWQSGAWVDLGPYPGIEIADNSIAKSKLNYLKNNSATANLVDLSRIKKGGFYRGDGTYEANDTWGELEITVIPGKTYKINSNQYHYSFWSQNGNYISGAETNTSSLNIVTPANARILKIPAAISGTEFLKSENLIVIEGQFLDEEYPQAQVDKMTSLAVGQIPNASVHGVIKGNNLIYNISVEDNNYYLTIPSGAFVFYKNKFLGIPSQKILLAGMGQNLGTWLFYNPLTRTIFSQTDTWTKDYMMPLGVMFDTLNPAGWLLNFDGLFYFDGVRVNTHRPLSKQKLGIIGDSITEGVGTTKAYHAWFPQLLGCDVINYGVGGTSITKKSGTFPSWDTQPAFVERYQQMSNDLDVIAIFGGVNDWITSRPLGQPTDVADTTLYGALNVLFKSLRQKYNGKPIFVFTPMQTDWTQRPANEGTTDGRNKDGYYLHEYVDVIKTVATKYAIPVCDLYTTMFYPFDEAFTTAYMPDFLHPNVAGHRLMAPKMSSFISSNI